MIKRSQRAAVAATLMLTAMSAWQAYAANPAVLEQIPNDAQAAVVIKDLKATSNKLNNAATRMGLPGVPPDLLKEVTQKLGISKGLDEKGSAALVVVKLDNKLGDDQAGPPLVMLLPTTDHKALLEPFKPEAPEDGIMKITVPTENETTGYAAATGKFVALAQDKAVLTKFLAKKATLDTKLTPEVSRAFETNDLVIWGNVPSFSADAIKSLEDFKGLVTMSMAMNGNQPASSQAGVDAVFGGLKQVLTDATVGLVTVRLDDNGAALGFQGHFTADSTIGKAIAEQKPLAGVSLDGLPAAQPLAAGAMTWNGTQLQPFLDKFIDAVSDAAAAKDEKTGAQFKKAMDLQKQAMALVTGGKFAIYENPDKAKGYIHGVIVLDVDAAKYQNLALQSIKDSAGANLDPNINIETKVTEKDLTVKGIALTKVQMKYTAADTPAGKEALAVVSKMYGPDGTTFYIGQISPKQVINIIGDAKAAEEAVVAAQANDPALGKTPALTTASKAVVENPIGVTYLSVDRWIDLAKQESGGKPTPAPANPPVPVVVSVGAKGSNMTAEIYIPMTTMVHAAEVWKESESGGAGGMRP